MVQSKNPVMGNSELVRSHDLHSIAEIAANDFIPPLR